MAEKNITISGRLSFPVWTMERAIALNSKSEWPVDADRVACTFNMFLEQDQLNKLINHLKNVYLPWVVTQDGKRGGLPKKEVDKLIAEIDKGDWLETPYNFFIKGMKEKDLEVAPEAAAFIKVKGTAGQNLVQKAVVYGEDELLVPLDITDFPAIVLASQTTHELYAGAVVATTLNLYAFMSGKNPGIAAGAPAVVFKADAEQIGGTKLDEDEIFLD